jgi:hypothetical protein
VALVRCARIPIPVVWFLDFFQLKMSRLDEEVSNEFYLKRCKVGENDPAILFDWHVDVLQQFVEGANQDIVGPQAFFITTAPGNMTVLLF